MKTCFKCGLEKPYTEFYTHPKMADGHLGKCKSCTKNDVKTNYVNKRPQYSAYENVRNQLPERRAAKRGYEKAHRERNPEKARARYLLGNAVRDGRIQRMPCSKCGATKAQGHHHDYSKPLDVTWMCFKCHREDGHGQVVSATDYVQ